MSPYAYPYFVSLCHFNPMLLSGNTIYSTFFFFPSWPEWRCMGLVCVTVYHYGLWLPPPSSSSSPAPKDPLKAEWQASRLAKWWNDDPIMRSDSKIRGIAQRLPPSLCVSSYGTLPAVQIMIDWLWVDHRKHPLIFQCCIKNIYLHVHCSQ